MYANSKNIRGTTSSLLTITNDDINASWLTVTGSTLTADTTLFVGAQDVMAKIDGKQDIVDGTTDLTVNDLDVTGNLTVDTDVFYVDSTNNRVGVNTLTPESSLQVVGARQGVPTTVGVHIGHSSGTNYGMELCSDATASSGIDFTKPSSNRRGAIGYNNSTEVMSFTVNNGVQLTLANLEANFQDNNITTTGNIQCADATMTGDLTVDTNTFHVDSALNGVSVGASLSTNTPQGALSVYGPFTTDSPTERGIHMSLKDDAIALMQMCSGGGALHPCLIEFTQPGSDYKGRIEYNHTSNDLNFEVENTDVLNLTTTTADFQGLAITTTGSIITPNITTTGATQTFSVAGSTQLTISASQADFQNNTITTSGNITSSSGTIQGNTITCDNILTTQDLDVDRHATIYGNLTATSGIASFNLTTVSDDLLVGANLFVDKSLNGVSIGTSASEGNSPQGALSIYGPYTTDTPTKKGIHMSLKNDNTPLIQMCGDPDHLSKIEFTTPSSDYEGLIEYNHSDHAMQFEIDTTLVLDLITTQADFQGLDIITTGDISCNVLNHSGTFSTTDVVCDNLTCNTLLTMSGAPLSSDSAITTTGAVNCGDLNITGSITGFSLQDIYNDNDVEPHITVNASHPVTFQGHAAVTNTFQCRDPVGTNVFQVSKDGDITGNGNATISGDLTVDTNALFVDSTNNGVSVGANVSTNVPQCALSVYGPYNTTTPTEKGIHMSLESDNVPIINMCSGASSTGKIQFNQAGSNKGGITYNHSDNGMQLEVENSVLMDLSTSQTMVYGDFTVDTNSFHVDSTNNHVGVGTTSPESALQIVGARQGVPTTVGVHIGHSSGTNYGLELCSNATDSSGIDFTKPNSNRRGAIGYSNSSEIMSFTANNSVQLTLANAEANFQDNNIITTGTIDANLNSTRGQLLTYMGEESGRLNVNAYDFNYGNGRNSDSRFGMITGVQSLKLKRFTYAGESGGSYTTSTRIVFQLYIDNTAQSVYMYCDFSNTTNGSVTNKRFNEKFSSSATSQIDTEPTITKTWGVSLSWRTITLTSYDIACVGHRISVVAESQDDL